LIHEAVFILTTTNVIGLLSFVSTKLKGIEREYINFILMLSLHMSVQNYVIEMVNDSQTAYSAHSYTFVVDLLIVEMAILSTITVATSSKYKYVSISTRVSIKNGFPEKN
jgi:hypothetical protein